MKRSIKIFLLLLLFGNGVAFAQAGEEKTPGLIKNKKFVFYATSAAPQNMNEISKVMRNIPGSTSGGYITLDNGYYDLVVKPDSLIAYLPFFGRNYAPSYDLDDRRYDYTSTDFSYEETKGRISGWSIKIKPRDVKNGVVMFLNITPIGYATLTVSDNNRSSISFNGYIDEARQPKKKKEKV